MKIIAEKICTISSSMTIKYTKISDFFPFSTVFRSRQIENDGHSVFIIIPDRALIGRCCISLYVSIGLETVFCRLEVGDWQHYFRQRREGIFINANISGAEILDFRMQIHLFSNDLIGLSYWRLGL